MRSPVRYLRLVVVVGVLVVLQGCQAPSSFSLRVDVPVALELEVGPPTGNLFTSRYLVVESQRPSAAEGLAQLRSSFEEEGYLLRGAPSELTWVEFVGQVGERSEVYVGLLDEYLDYAEEDTTEAGPRRRIEASDLSKATPYLLVVVVQYRSGLA